MIKTNELPAMTGFAPTDSFLVDMPRGTGRLSGQEAAKFMRSNIPTATTSAPGLMSPEQVIALNGKAEMYHGKIVYVAPDGNDGTGDGSESAPFYTLQRAFDSFNNGVRSNIKIFMLPGTYNYILSGHEPALVAQDSSFLWIEARDGANTVTVNVTGTESDGLGSGIFGLHRTRAVVKNITFNYKTPVAKKQRLISLNHLSWLDARNIQVNVLQYSGGAVSNAVIFCSETGSSLFCESVSFAYEESNNTGIGALIETGGKLIVSVLNLKSGFYGPKIGNSLSMGSAYIWRDASWSAWNTEDIIAGSGVIHRQS